MVWKGEDWCLEIKERLRTDQFSSKDVCHGLNCVDYYYRLFGHALDEECSEKLAQIFLQQQDHANRSKKDDYFLPINVPKKMIAVGITFLIIGLIFLV